MTTVVTVTEPQITATVVEDAITATIVNEDVTVTVGTGVTDHGALTGLSDDDHAQYLNTARHAAIGSNPHGVTAPDVGALPLTGGTMTGALVLDGDPSAALEAATKQYVDANAGGASDVGDLTTATGNAGEMVRVASGGGLEYRSTAQVLSDIGAAASGHDHDADYVDVTGDTMTGTLAVQVPTTSTHGLTLQSTDDSTARNLLQFLTSAGSLLGRMRVDGYFEWGNTSFAGATDWYIGDGRYFMLRDTSNNQVMRVNANGSVSFLGNVAYTIPSNRQPFKVTGIAGGMSFPLMTVERDGIKGGIFRVSQDNIVTVLPNDTTAISASRNVLVLGNNAYTGTPAAGFGAGLLYQLESSTTENRDAARIAALWNTATDASRKADLVLSAYDTAEREFLRGRGNGSAAAVGFLGATPAVRQSHIADPSGGTTEDAEARAAINSILTVLETFGLVATS